MANGAAQDNWLKDFFISLRVGFFLAVRQIRRANIWTNVLVTCVMMLTFLNLVVVSGILVGLIEGSVNSIKLHYLGDVFLSTLKEKPYIEQSPSVITVAEHLPGVQGVTARYIEAGKIEAEYKTKKRPTDIGEVATTSFAGIDPAAEDQVASLSKLVIEGQYLNANDYDQILVGSLLLKKYLDFESPNFPVLDHVDIGTRVRVTLGGNMREMTVKGILKSKVDEIDRRVFMIDSQMRSLVNRHDYNVNEIVLRLAPGVNPTVIKNQLLANGVGNYAKVQTQEEAEPKFVKDMIKTFDILGNVISSIGLVVAAITIFIVIFINAITRRKYIGILKGVGIHSLAIEFAYIVQSFFYAVMGTAFGVAVVFGFLKPYLDRHPINFPFSDGILVATARGTMARIAVLLIATLIAGYIPAKLVTRQNTLDAILNR